MVKVKGSSGGIYVVDSHLRPHVLEYMRRRATEAKTRALTSASSSASSTAAAALDQCRFDATACLESLPPQYARQKQNPLLKTIAALIGELRVSVLAEAGLLVASSSSSSSAASSHSSSATSAQSASSAAASASNGSDSNKHRKLNSGAVHKERLVRSATAAARNDHCFGPIRSRMLEFSGISHPLFKHSYVQFYFLLADCAGRRLG